MARPYPDKFEREISPLSPQSGGPQTPVSYSANVNRQKTKKWVEAKPADYGGDDWGDEYGDYSAPTPPVLKTTGLRQPGQILQSASSATSAVGEFTKKAYGDLPSLPMEVQTRSVTIPAGERANFFTRDDERRAFSGGGYTQNPVPNSASVTSRILSLRDPVPSSSSTAQSNHPPTLQVSTQIPAVTGLGNTIQPNFPVTVQIPSSAVRGTTLDEPQSGTSSKYSESTSKYSEIRTPSSDFHTRKDFSPSAVPPPLQTKYSPGPQSATADSASSRFPPRKSSISHSIPPEVSQQSQVAQDINSAKPWTEGRSSSPGPTARSPTSSVKGLPFIRPADIYRRMEEEREKERQSMDSSRPSMESIVGANTRERSTSPAQPSGKGLTSSDSAGHGFNRMIQDSEDRTDSSRRLAPMLEPVQERKSEYGFEGYDPAQATKPPAEQVKVAIPAQPQTEPFSHDEMRRFSSSPKLPDLNRISGFGLDLFLPSSANETGFHDSALKTLSETSSLSYQNDSGLRAQPSLRSTSVVKQESHAEDSSNPDALAPAADVGFGGSVREDPLITGISPAAIVSPITTPAITLNREMGSSESTVPSISEVNKVAEKSSPMNTSADILEPQLNPLSDKIDGESESHLSHPMSHSNVNTPSPGISPVMTHSVAAGEGFAPGGAGHTSTTPDPAISPVEEELLTTSRPSAEREHSFRPNLPGGWVSYATSAAGSTVEQEPRDNQRLETHNQHADPMDAPVSPISESEEDTNDIDLTPTTAKRPLTQSALGATAVAVLGNVATTTFGRRDKGIVQDASGHDTSVQSLHRHTGSSSLPISDPAIAPIGNPYTVSPLDPRLQGGPSTGTSALSVPFSHGHSALSETSTQPPTPPPKDTPFNDPPGETSEYFPPTVPLKHKTLDEMAASEGLVIPMRPQMLPTLSTQTSPQDEESDKLRKEIIKSLSPHVSVTDGRQRLSSSDVIDNNHLEDSTGLAARESTYLPSEYDNYWESTNEAEAEQSEREAKAQGLGVEQEPDAKGFIQGIYSDFQQVHENVPPIPPLSPHRAERASMEMPLQRPALSSNRFSWEAGPEQVSSKTPPFNSQLQVPRTQIDPRYASTPDSHLQQLEQTREAYIEHGPIITSDNTPSVEAAPVINAKEEILTTATTANDQRKLDGNDSTHSHTKGDAVILAEGIAGATVYGGDQANQPAAPKRRLSLAEEKNPANASTYAVSPTPPEDEHPARVSQHTVPQLAPKAPLSDQGEGRNPVLTYRPQPTPDATKIIQFRDILTLQNPEQRIQAYNDTRYQFASMETGLAEWVLVLSNSDPNSWISPVSGGIGGERAKVVKSSPQSAPGTPLQQPYYQQYLNASPTSSVPSMTRPGTGITSGSQQGFSPSGSKLAGQQTKSKDLLHTAGVFGGKASKAGKGLFVKGKNKFRGSGGGDKDSPPLEASIAPKPKANEGRRSSWNMSLSSLTLPRSSARTSTPSQHSREATPPPQRQSLQGLENHAIATSHPSSGPDAENRPVPVEGQTELSIWNAPVSAASSPSIHPSTPQPRGASGDYTIPYTGSKILATDGNEEQDTLGVPAPIGKEQPSWDPYNATPIVEEEGFQYEERSVIQPAATTSAIHPSVAPKAAVDTISDRSASGDAIFYDASEHPADSEDWVIVSKDHVPKLSELSFAAPATLQKNSVPSSEIQSQRSEVSPPSGSYQSLSEFQPVTNYHPSEHQSIAGYQLPTGLQSLAGYQSPAGYQPPSQHQPSALNQISTASQPTVHPPTFSLPRADPQTRVNPQPKQIPQLQGNVQPQASTGGFRGRFIQHIRQRSSKDGSMPVATKPSTPPATTKIDQAQSIEGINLGEKKTTDFVGLPPIRRSSTFGLGFRTKDPSKRFSLDDEEEEEELKQGPLGPLIPESSAINEQQDAVPKNGILPDSAATNGSDSQVSGWETALGAAVTATGIGDRMNQPSGEPSRHPVHNGSAAQGFAVTQQRPPLSNVSSEYSHHSSFSPISPPVSSPVSLPGSRQALAADSARESVNTLTGLRISAQQLYAGQDAVRLSQEQRISPPMSYKRPPVADVPQNASQTPPAHPRHPSFEGQRHEDLTYNGRDPLEAQRVRSVSSTDVPNTDTLPILSSGVFVPPPRAGVNQQKPFDQPPSSAQRYPALFRAEHEGKATSVDGLPANYYQAPISKEDAFLPRQQTNEYQLPGVGPPPDQPQSGKRSSRRNSALFKELGGRLSRSASRDRESTIDDDGRSPIRPVDSRDSQSRDYSAASVTSEDTLEKKKRVSGLSFFGALRRESAGGPTQSRENMVTHLPPSRTDSLMQPSSPLVPPDKKKSFFNGNRNSPDPEKLKPNTLLRASTSNVVSEQTGKKKRFSGFTNIFSKQSTHQERRGSSSSTARTTQDTLSYQQVSPIPQGPQYLQYPGQQASSDLRRVSDVTQPSSQSSPPPQSPSPNQQVQYAKGTAVYASVGQNTMQSFQNSPRPQRQGSPVGRSTQPLPSPSFSVNPTLQHSVIETPPLQDRHSSHQYSPSWQNSQNHLRQTSGGNQPVPLLQPVLSPQSQQSYIQHSTNMIQPTSQIPIGPSRRSPQRDYQQTSDPTSQVILKSQSPLDRPQSTQSSPLSPLLTKSQIATNHPQPIHPDSQSPSNRSPQTLTTAQLGPSSQTQPKPQLLEDKSSQASLGPQHIRSSQPSASPATGQYEERRASGQQIGLQQGAGQVNPPAIHIPHQAQYQQLGLAPSQYSKTQLASSPHLPSRTNQETQPGLTKQSPVLSGQLKVENKQRQGSTSKLWSGLIGGRRSSGQQVKGTTDSGVDIAPRQVPVPWQPQLPSKPQPVLQQQPQPQQWYEQQRMPPNGVQYRMPDQNQRTQPVSQEPQYAPLPIPGAYNLVRGEGGQLVPTPYDPRGLNTQPGLYSNHQQYMNRERAYSSQIPQVQVQPSAVNKSASRSGGFPSPQMGIIPPQNLNMDVRPNPSPQQNSQNSQISNKSARPLSSEDLVARSPARPQFGQQAPYQLRLPDENPDNTGEDRQSLSENSRLLENRVSKNGTPQVDRGLPKDTRPPVQLALAPLPNIITNQQTTKPSLRQPQSPATYPLPDHTPFSPINPKADQVPPPPPPKWPQQTTLSQNLDRSSTRNTTASDISQVLGSRLSVPGSSESKEQIRPASVTPPSPQITPERSPKQALHQVTSEPHEEDVYSASPRRSVVVASNQVSVSEAPHQSPEKILVGERDFQNGRRRTSQEEKILVEEGMVRPGSEQEEIPSMSATSYPGQEWHPYGNGYEEWD